MLSLRIVKTIMHVSDADQLRDRDPPGVNVNGWKEKLRKPKYNGRGFGPLLTCLPDS